MNLIRRKLIFNFKGEGRLLSALVSFSFILLVSLFFISANTQTINPTDTNKTIDSKQINVSGLTLEVSSTADIQWKQESNSFTPEYKDDSYYNIVKDSKTGVVLNKTLKYLPTITFKVNKLEDVSCTSTFYQTTCTGSRWDFSKFESKNDIMSKEIIPYYYDSVLRRIVYEIKSLLKIDTIPIGYDIVYTGIIKDLDPVLDLVYTTTSPLMDMNRTEASSAGARLSASVLFMDFNTPEETNTATTKYVKDGSVYNNLGTFNLTGTNPIYNATGGYDGSGAYMFDGVDDYITSSNNLDSTFSGANAKFTISGWINMKGNGGNNMIFSRDTSSQNLFFLRSLNNKTSFLWYGDLAGLTYAYYTGLTNLNYNNWYHVVAVYDATQNLTNKVKIYVNGLNDNATLINSGSPLYIQSSTTPLYLGSLVDGSPSYTWNGSIDQVQILPYALTSSEVLCLYNGTGTGCGGRNNSAYLSKYAYPSGDFKSLVFYNSTQTYWNVTLAHSANSVGSIADVNGINLSDPNLVSYWDLDSGGTDVNPYNDEKGSNDGTPTGTNNATGISSGAMRFDGVDDYVDVGLPFNPANFSSCIWFNPSSISAGFHHLYNDNGDFAISNVAGTIQIYTDPKGGWWNTGYTVAINNWYHLCFTYNGSVNNLYMNNILSANVSATSAWSYAGGNHRIGSGSSDYYFNGTIDEVLIYNTSLSASQISQLYKSGLSQHANTNVTIQTRTANTYNISDSGLVSFWSFNNDNATLVIDEKGVNNGTYMNGSLSNSSSGMIGNGGYFDGVNDLITLTNLNTLTNNSWTISGWFYSKKITSNPLRERIITFHRGSSAGSGLIMGAGNTSKFMFAYYNAGSLYYVDVATINTNQWYQGVITYNGTSYKGYLDGDLKSTTTNGFVGFGSRNAVIGNYDSTDTTYGFNGTIDEVRIYNRSLSASEILDLYNLGATHVSDWGEWSTESLAEDNVGTLSSSSGKFMQFKTILNTDDTAISPYIINHSVASTYEYVPADSTYPTFQIGTFNITSGGIYSYLQRYSANATISNTNGTAGISFNGVNYTTTNVSNLYQANLGSLGAGTFDYYWWALGNGSLNLYNSSEIYSYTIEKADSISGMSLTGDSPITYPTEIDITYGETNEGDGGCSYNIDNTDGLYGAGTWGFNYSTIGCANYSEGSKYLEIEVLQNDSYGLSLEADPSWYGMIGDWVTVTGLGCPTELTCELFRDDIPKFNPNVAQYFNGTYVFVYNTTGNSNYSVGSTTQNLYINVTAQTPSTNVVPECSYCKLGYYNLNLPWMREEDCICTNKLGYGIQKV